MANDENLQGSTTVSTETTSEEIQNSSGKQTVLVKERFEIDFNRPLKWLDCNGALAYKVNDRIDTRRDLFALVCGSETAPRSSILSYMKSIDHPNIIKLVEYGVITNPLKNNRTVALIYATPQGGKVLDSLDEVNFKANPAKFKQVILELISAAEALKGYGITHRSIRPDNLFFKNKEHSNIVIGDCIASFPAFYQPPMFETIENLMAFPAGRGNGTEKDDIYSIGATCISLLQGKNPLKDMSVPEIIRMKMKKGSYSALTFDDKIPSIFTTILKGLTTDEPVNRWNFIQTYNFIEGKGTNFSAQTSTEKPKRSLTINGEKCYTAQEVAYYLYLNPDESWDLIKSKKLLEWIKNGLENEKIYTEVDKLITQHNENESRDVLIAQICILIDPNAPIHIKGISVFPNGTPKAIYYCLKNQLDINDFYDLFNSDLIRSWYMVQENVRSPANASEFKIYINRKDIGYGLDRIMYDFDEDLPCVSPLIGDEYINTAPRILKALDQNYSNLKGQLLPYDKNIIAFLRCKLGKKIDGILLDLNSKKEATQISAIIRLYTDMQNKYGPAQLINLGKWLSAASRPIIKSYHSLKLQKAIERELLRVSKEGKLINICKVLENTETRLKDREQFKSAEKEVIALLTEKNKLTDSGYKLDEEAQDLAIKFAGILAVLTMIASFVFNLSYWISK